MKLNSIKITGTSDFVMMGPVRLRQPIPTGEIDMIDPFVLLHHYGPYEISEENNPFDLGPHPHRGFEPVTFLIQGEQLHRDSLGNESIVKAGDVQWTTAGRGIIHAEGPTRDFVRKGGMLEGIQLWLNLPANKKMIPAAYQHVRQSDFNVVTSEDGKVDIQVIAGNLEGMEGQIKTQTPVNAYMIDMQAESSHAIRMDKDHLSLLYLLHGKALVNSEETLLENGIQLVQFNNDGEGFRIESDTGAKLLFLSGIPHKEPVTSWGPYVMNTQTEILEALRDYQLGKMGFLPAN